MKTLITDPDTIYSALMRSRRFHTLNKVGDVVTIRLGGVPWVVDSIEEIGDEIEVNLTER